MNEPFEAHACVCHVCVDQRQREETLIVLQSHLLDALSEAKDPLPLVTPSRCHLGNRCRGELPGGIADLCWLHSTELQPTSLPQDACSWTDRQFITPKCGGKLQKINAMSSVSFNRVKTTIRHKNGDTVFSSDRLFWFTLNGDSLMKLLYDYFLY